MSRLLETERPDLSDELNRLLVVRMLTSGDAYNQPQTMEIPEQLYDDFQTWLWGSPVPGAKTRWKTVLLLRRSAADV